MKKEKEFKVGQFINKLPKQDRVLAMEAICEFHSVVKSYLKMVRISKQND